MLIPFFPWGESLWGKGRDKRLFPLVAPMSNERADICVEIKKR